ncbi:MAG: CPBP family intramembrane metalloprotease [Burkholderiales bacterium]|nr:MAG: CPBP family intramembrane metalloprotease [Burkholderiales bacterium]
MVLSSSRLMSCSLRFTWVTIGIPGFLVAVNGILGWLGGTGDGLSDCPRSDCLLCTLLISPLLETLIFQLMVGELALKLFKGFVLRVGMPALLFGILHYIRYPSLIAVISATFAGAIFSCVYARRSLAGSEALGVLEVYVAHACTNTLVWLSLPAECFYRPY